MAANAVNPIRLYIDGADREAAQPWLDTGMFSGVTTNPQLLQAAGARLSDLPEIYKWARGDGERDVFMQVWGKTPQEMYDSALHIRTIGPQTIIKVPCTFQGTQVIYRLRKEGIPVLMTSIYSGKQALTASALDVDYLAPYFNRMFRAGRNGLEQVNQMVNMVPQDGTGPWIMAASLRSAEHLVSLAQIGVRHFTLSTSVLPDLLEDDLTAKSVSDFEEFMGDVLD